MQDDFEVQLRRALRPVEAPPDFAAKVLARARAQRVVAFPRWIAAVAAALVLAAGVGQAIHVERVRRAERARDQLILALRITKAKLDYTRQRLEKKNHDH